jgi:hypothetical protein
MREYDKELKAAWRRDLNTFAAGEIPNLLPHPSRIVTWSDSVKGPNVTIYGCTDSRSSPTAGANTVPASFSVE